MTFSLVLFKTRLCWQVLISISFQQLCHFHAARAREEELESKTTRSLALFLFFASLSLSLCWSWVKKFRYQSVRNEQIHQSHFSLELTDSTTGLRLAPVLARFVMSRDWCLLWGEISHRVPETEPLKALSWVSRCRQEAFTAGGR